MNKCLMRSGIVPDQGIINTAKGSHPSELAPSETLRLSPGPSIFIRAGQQGQVLTGTADKRVCNRVSAADQRRVNSSYDVAWRYPRPRHRLDGLKMRCPSSRLLPGWQPNARRAQDTPPGALVLPRAGAFTARPYGTSSPARSQRASSAPTLHSPTAYPHDLRP
jgi:hypothetical protein